MNKEKSATESSFKPHILESFYLEIFARKNVVQTDDLESIYLEIKQRLQESYLHFFC